jgi:hypothetical protein
MQSLHYTNYGLHVEFTRIDSFPPSANKGPVQTSNFSCAEPLGK